MKSGIIKFGIISIGILFIFVYQIEKGDKKVFGKESAYTVEFVANGGKGIMKPQKIMVNKITSLKKCCLYRKGYIFAGWAKTKNGKIKYKNQTKVKNLTSSGKKIKLYAKWRKDGVRRALILGHTTKSVIKANTLRAIGMMMGHSSFYGKNMERIELYPDHTVDEIITYFKEVFCNTKSNDISYIYIVCHSSRTGYLYLGADETYITPTKLRELCDENIKGTVVVMIESCFSGTVIGQSTSQIEDNELDCSEHILNEFINPSSSNATLTTSKYKVICSSRKDETSIGGDLSLATKYWSLGGGWNQNKNKECKLKADVNKDNKVTLKELYNYSYKKVKKERPKQHICAYPKNSNFVVFGRFKY